MLAYEGAHRPPADFAWEMVGEELVWLLRLLHEAQHVLDVIILRV